MRNEYDFSDGKRGAVLPAAGKTRITIMLDDDVIAFFRERAEAVGAGYQTLINAALRSATKDGDRGTDMVTADTLRKILREELRAL